MGQRLGRPEIGVILNIFLSNCSRTCICSGLNQQIPPYLSEFHSDLTFLKVEIIILAEKEGPLVARQSQIF